jgi:hypothetical protein
MTPMPSPTPRCSGLWPILVGALLLVACGASEQRAQAPAAPTAAPEPAPGRRAEPTMADAPKDSAAGVAPKAAASPSMESTSRADADVGSIARQVEAIHASLKECATACRSLHSLARSVVHLCRLEGADASPCREAIRLLDQSKREVSASCPGCTASMD